MRPMTVLSGEQDLCGTTYGGGACKDDFQCGNGWCVAGRCKCEQGWGCDYCTMDVEQAIEAGATCGDFITGQGFCVDDSQCHYPNGTCVEGKCTCGAGYGCAYCNEKTVDLIKGDRMCSCDGINCNSGTCVHGTCSCFRGFSGMFCDYEPCEDVVCGEHGYCDMLSGKCVCETGFEGDDCSKGGGACSSVVDCGQHIRGEFGGFCNNVTNTCDCYNGFTCQHCEAKGDVCHDSAGGGECRDNTDCGTHAHGTGGSCIKAAGATVGSCACFDGFTCSNCDKRGEKCSDAAGGGVCTDKYDCGFFGDGLTGGDCIEGHCSCHTGFACPLCTSTGDACSESAGGAPCDEDTDCGNFGEFTGGKCLAGKCVCEPGFTCARCQAEGIDGCKTARGGAKCRFDSDCGEDPDAPGGECIAKDESGFGICKCYGSFGCPSCTTHVAWLAAGKSCEMTLESGAAYANLTTDRSLLPQEQPTDYSALYYSLAVVAGIIVIIIACIVCLEIFRWKKMTKAIQNAAVVHGKPKRRRRKRRHSRRPRTGGTQVSSQGAQSWYFGPARPEWSSPSAAILPQDPNMNVGQSVMSPMNQVMPAPGGGQQFEDYGDEGYEHQGAGQDDGYGPVGGQVQQFYPEDASGYDGSHHPQQQQQQFVDDKHAYDDAAQPDAAMEAVLQDMDEEPHAY